MKMTTSLPLVALPAYLPDSSTLKGPESRRRLNDFLLVLLAYQHFQRVQQMLHCGEYIENKY